MKLAYGFVVGGALKLQEQASTRSSPLVLIPNNTKLDVKEYDGEWYVSSYAGHTGYVMKKFVRPSQFSVKDKWRYGQVISNTLNVRKQPSHSAALWNNVWPRNRIALVKPEGNGWYETRYRGDKAYISGAYIRFLEDSVPDHIVERMLYMAPPELGQTKSTYYTIMDIMALGAMYLRIGFPCTPVCRSS